MKNKKILLVIIPIIVFFVIAIVAGIAIVTLGILNKDKIEDKINSKWGDIYYTYLKDIIKSKENENLEEYYGVPKNIENGKIQFCQNENDDSPNMVLTYENDGKSKMNIYNINEDGNVNKTIYNDKTELKYLYNIKTEKYGWYVCETNDSEKIYTELENVKEKDETKIIKVKNKETTVTVNNNETVKLSEFNENFVEPENVVNETFDFNLDLQEEDLKNEIKQSVDNFESKKIISDEQKDNVKKEVEKINETIKAINESKEKNKSIVGTWRINSNVKSNIQEYSNLMSLFGSSLKLSSNELVLKDDGTFTFYVGVAYNTSGKYKFENNTVTVYEIKDAGISDEKTLKDMEKNLKFDLMEFKNNQFLKFYVYDRNEAEIYVFFEKNTNGSQGTMSDQVPEVTFKNPIKNNEKTETNNTQNSNTTVNNNVNTATNENKNTTQNTNTNTNTNTTQNTASSNKENTNSGIKIGNKTIKYGTYNGEDIATGQTLVIKSNGTATWDGKTYKYSVGKYNFGQDSSSKSSQDGLLLKNSDGTTAFALYVRKRRKTL